MRAKRGFAAAIHAESLEVVLPVPREADGRLPHADERDEGAVVLGGVSAPRTLEGRRAKKRNVEARAWSQDGIGQDGMIAGARAREPGEDGTAPRSPGIASILEERPHEAARAEPGQAAIVIAVRVGENRGVELFDSLRAQGRLDGHASLVAGFRRGT